MSNRKIAYEPHPVDPERKKQLIQSGYKIVDEVFKPSDYVPPVIESDESLVEQLKKERETVKKLNAKVKELESKLKKQNAAEAKPAEVVEDPKE